MLWRNPSLRALPCARQSGVAENIEWGWISQDPGGNYGLYTCQLWDLKQVTSFFSPVIFAALNGSNSGSCLKKWSEIFATSKHPIFHFWVLGRDTFRCIKTCTPKNLASLPWSPDLTLKAAPALLTSLLLPHLSYPYLWIHENQAASWALAGPRAGLCTQTSGHAL